MSSALLTFLYHIIIPFSHVLKPPGPYLKGRQLSFPTPWEICWEMPRVVSQGNAIGSPLLACDSTLLLCIPRVVVTAASALLLPLYFAAF